MPVKWNTRRTRTPGLKGSGEGSESALEAQPAHGGEPQGVVDDPGAAKSDGPDDGDCHGTHPAPPQKEKSLP